MPETPQSRLSGERWKPERMPQSPEAIIQTVEIVVPPEVEQRARERAGDDAEIELYLLDEFRFEYEWVFVGENEE